MGRSQLGQEEAELILSHFVLIHGFFSAIINGEIR